jgi:hypothetical protein
VRAFSFALVAGIWQERRTVWPREMVAGFTVHCCAVADAAEIAESRIASSMTNARRDLWVRQMFAMLMDLRWHRQFFIPQ